MAEPKYRPSLTLAQLKAIVSDMHIDSAHRASIVKVLRPFILKAEEGLVQPAFVTREKPSLEDSLGLTSQPKDEAKQLWNLYTKGIALSDSQRIAAWGYAFTNDLLTPEQETEYTEMLLKS